MPKYSVDTNEGLAWLAGLFDGEGSINMQKLGKASCNGNVILTQKNTSVVAAAVYVCERYELPTPLEYDRERGVKRLMWPSIRGAGFLLAILPWMNHSKQRRRAALYIERYNLKNRGKGNRNSQDAIWERWKELVSIEAAEGDACSERFLTRLNLVKEGDE